MDSDPPLLLIHPFIQPQVAAAVDRLVWPTETTNLGGDLCSSYYYFKTLVFGPRDH